MAKGSVSAVKPDLTSSLPDTNVSAQIANDGSINKDSGVWSDDTHYLQWTSGTVLGSISVTLAPEASANDTAVVMVKNGGNSLGNGLLTAGVERGLDISNIEEGTATVTVKPDTSVDIDTGDSTVVRDAASTIADDEISVKIVQPSAQDEAATADTTIGGGLYTVIFKAENLVGNTTTITVPKVKFVPGAANITLYSPSEASINAETADPTIEVDRPLTQISFYYKAVESGRDPDINEFDIIAENLQVGVPTEYAVPRDKDGDPLLKEGVKYTLVVETRDDAGNRTTQQLSSESAEDVEEFTFDSEFDAATAASIEIVVDENEGITNPAHEHAPKDKKLVFSTGQETDVRITVVSAASGDDKPIQISTYRDDITVTVVDNEDIRAALGLEAEQSLLAEGAEDKGVTLTGKGVTDNGDGTFTIAGSALAGGTIRLMLKSERNRGLHAHGQFYEQPGGSRSC